jgi:hypothetical protein
VKIKEHLGVLFHKKVEVKKEMYSTIVLDCQTKTDAPYCEDCIVKKICKARIQNQKQKQELQLETALAIEIVA